MSPRDRRRRSRRRTPWGWVAVAAVVAIAAVLLIAGLAQEPRSSAPYHQAIDRSVATRAALVADASNRTGRQLATLVDQMPTLTRLQLQVGLDGLASEAKSEADQAAALSPPAASNGSGSALAQVFAERYQAVDSLRRSVDGLLGMAPLPVPGVPSAAGATGATTNLLSASQVTTQLVGVGATLTAADADYRQVRSQLAQLTGRTGLPPSRWVTDARLWNQGPVTALVDELTNSATLVTDHRVQLLYIHLTPGVVPPASGEAPSAGSVSVVPPTTTLAVTALVVNHGQVGESGLTATATLQPASGGTSQSRQQKVSLRPGGSVAVDFPAFPVVPGTTYVLAVSVSPPPGQVNRVMLSGQLTVAVAPATPATTAPTTTTTTRAP